MTTYIDQKALLAALTMPANSGLREAPPTKSPSTDLMDKYSEAFFPLALPP